MKHRVFSSLVAAGVVALGMLSPSAWAAYPDKPVRIIVPFPPGGPVDVVTRAVAERMGAELKQSVIIDNKAGAAGQIGSTAAAKSAADGYTLLMGSSSTHSLPSLLQQKLNYDPVASFAPVGMVGLAPTVLAVSTKLPVTDYKSFVDYAKRNPGKLSYASSGNGTLNHLVSEAFKMQSGVFLVHIPYRGTGQAMADLVAGQVDMMFDATVTVIPQAQGGRIRPLAIASRKRSSRLPDVPTLDELGLKDFDGSLWLGIFAPAGTPPEIVTTLNTALNAALKTPALRERLVTLGFEASPGLPVSLSAYMKAVEARWGRVVRERNIKAQ